MNDEEIKKRLLELFKAKPPAPMRKRSLAKALRIRDEDYPAFRKLLAGMVKHNELAELHHGKFGLPAESASTPQPERLRSAGGRGGRGAEEDKKPKNINAKAGRIEVKRGGMGFLLSDPPGQDVFIAPEDLGGALSGDLVEVEMKRRSQAPGRRGRKAWGGAGWSRPAGRVVRIVERAHKRLVGTFYADPHPHGPAGHILPDTPGLFHELEVLAPDRGNAGNGDKVAVELIEPAAAHRSGAQPSARVVQVFGPAGEPEADIAAILENYNIPTKFPDEVLRGAEELPEEIPAAELAQRTSYEQPVTFTIDPSDAKDHDDAVALRRLDDGRFNLLVHIADVSHYVPEDSPIDLEARSRGTSVYLPAQVYPMLPQKLSNNLCSLREGRVRLTKTVSITFNKNLAPQQVKIERSYIRSAAFLTYDQVKEALDEDKPELVRTPEILETLRLMKEFAGRLREKRLATGSLDLELPEARLLLDEKLEVTGWEQVEHHWAHELIEEMMLAANRAVAEFLVANELPGLFRTHEEPDSEALKRFADFAREFGVSLRPPYDRLKLKSVLDRVRGKDYAHTIHLALLTSLKQARYAVTCQPHFALNFSRYLHFTSPIRRYPDLLVHRALDTLFKPGVAALPEGGRRRAGGEQSGDYFGRLAVLRPLATHCSRRERAAEAAEEEVIKFKQIQFLRRNMKESHPGLITGVRDYGFFVEMQDCHLEGLVSLESLTDDQYVYFENRHLLQGRRKQRSFRLGDKITVRVSNIDLGRKQISLEVC